MIEKVKYSKIRHQLSESEKRVLDYCLDHPKSIERMTINQLAKQLFISPSTISRTAQKLGFHGFKELKYSFLKENSDLDHRQVEQQILSTSNQTYLNQFETKFKIALNHLNNAMWEKSIQLTHSAASIEIFALGGSEYLGKELSRKLQQLDYHCSARSDWDDLSRISKRLERDSLAIFISQTGETPLLLDWARNLNQNQVKIMSFIGYRGSRLEQLSSFNFYCPTELRYQEEADISSRLCLQFICDLWVWNLVEKFESD